MDLVALQNADLMEFPKEVDSAASPSASLILYMAAMVSEVLQNGTLIQ
jgi:flagellar basal body L-ring protein FlgH